MKRIYWFGLGILVVGIGLAWNLISTRHVLPRGLIGPPPAQLARHFLDAAARGDLEAALALTDGSETCVRATRDLYQKLVDQYPVIVADFLVVNSFWLAEAPQVEWVEVAFDRDPAAGQAPIYGVLDFTTTYTPLGRRFICGQEGRADAALE